LKNKTKIERTSRFKNTSGEKESKSITKVSKLYDIYLVMEEKIKNTLRNFYRLKDSCY
jgi:hypothetical protein